MTYASMWKYRIMQCTLFDPYLVNSTLSFTHSYNRINILNTTVKVTFNYFGENTVFPLFSSI